MNLPKIHHCINELELFRWADQHERRFPQTIGGQWLQRRYHVPPHLADFLAAQALLGGKQ